MSEIGVMNDELLTEEETTLFKEIDKGIDDMEAGRLTPHEDSMKYLRQQLHEYVVQNT